MYSLILHSSFTLLNIFESHEIERQYVQCLTLIPAVIYPSLLFPVCLCPYLIKEKTKNTPKNTIYKKYIYIYLFEKCINWHIKTQQFL